MILKKADGFRKRIYIIPSWYKTKKNPNSGCFFMDQAIALRKSGWDVIILAGGALGREDIFDCSSFRINYYEYHNVKVYEYRIPSFYIGRTMIVESLIWNFTLMILFLCASFKNGIPDIIHAHGVIGAYYSILWARLLYVPLVLTEHSFFKNNSNREIERSRKLKKVCSAADKIIVVSNGLAQNVKKMIKRHIDISIVPNIVNIEMFNPKVPIMKNNKYTFMSCGNLIKSKGFDILLKAYAIVKKAGISSQLVIIGDGPERQDLESLKEELGLGNEVEFAGMIARSKMPQYFRNCDCFCLASRFDTFGVVFIEAMASGKPIVATMTDGVRDIVSPEIGLIVSIDNIIEFAEAMIKMYQSKQEYSKERIREVAKNKYSEKSVALILEDIYKKCVANYIS